MSATESPVSRRSGLRGLLPIGLPLSDEAWAQRHRLILAVLALHLPILRGLALFRHHGSRVALYEFVGLVFIPGVIALSATRLVASAAASVALLGTSAVLV